MVHMSTNAEITRRSYGDNSHLTNFILNLGETCKMTPDISDFIPGSLVETDKYIEVADGNFSQRKKRSSSNKKNVTIMANTSLLSCTT